MISLNRAKTFTAPGGKNIYALIAFFWERTESQERKADWLAEAARSDHVDRHVLDYLFKQGADPLQAASDGILPLEHALQVVDCNPEWFYKVDILADLPLGRESGLDVCRMRTSLRPPLRGAWWETIKTFVDEVADPVVDDEVWGTNLISHVLDHAWSDGKAWSIAYYLYVHGYRDGEPSAQCEKWIMDLETGHPKIIAFDRVEIDKVMGYSVTRTASYSQLYAVLVAAPTRQMSALRVGNKCSQVYRGGCTKAWSRLT